MFEASFQTVAVWKDASNIRPRMYLVAACGLGWLRVD